jgi:hypothetical protein
MFTFFKIYFPFTRPFISFGSQLGFIFFCFPYFKASPSFSTVFYFRTLKLILMGFPVINTGSSFESLANCLNEEASQ